MGEPESQPKSPFPVPWQRRQVQPRYITTDRTVTIAGIDRLCARFNANAFSGRIEDGYRFVTTGKISCYVVPAWRAIAHGAGRTNS